MGRKLLRTMAGENFDGFTRPKLGENISRILGVRHRTSGTDPAGCHFDIVTDENGTITNLNQGLSVAPPPKENMSKHLRRLKPGESFFSIDEDFFENHSDLVYIEDEVQVGEVAKHGIIAPRYEMNIQHYISCLSATRTFWEVLNDEVNAENELNKALVRQLNAESKSIHFRAHK